MLDSGRFVCILGWYISLVCSIMWSLLIGDEGLICFGCMFIV